MGPPGSPEPGTQRRWKQCFCSHMSLDIDVGRVVVFIPRRQIVGAHSNSGRIGKGIEGRPCQNLEGKKSYCICKVNSFYHFLKSFSKKCQFKTSPNTFFHVVVMGIRTAGIRMAIRTAVIYKLLHGMVFQSMTSYAAYLLSLMPLCTRVSISTSIARPV